MDRNVGWMLVVVGLAVAAIGLLGSSGSLSWFGRLPGDVNVQRGNVRVFAPFVSMLVASGVLTVLFWLYQSFRRG